MYCNCNNKSNTDVAQIRHVYGNVLRLAIPLTLRTLTLDGGTVEYTDEPFYPSSEYPVEVVLSKGATKVRIEATMDGNVARIEDDGTIPIGVFSITVSCRDDNGRPYRFKQHTVLNVVDTTIEAGIEPTIEYEAATWYLDAAIFLATGGGGVSVQSDWAEEDTSSGAYIRNKPTIPVVPTNVSDFLNDAGYLTEHQSLAGLATTAQLQSLQNALNALMNNDDVEDTINSFNEIVDFLEGVTNDESLVGLLNELRTTINAKYSKPQGGIPAADLAGGIPTSKISGLSQVATSGSYNDLADKPTIPTIPTNVSSFTNDAGYLIQHQNINTVNGQSMVGLGNVDTIVYGIKSTTGFKTGQLSHGNWSFSVNGLASYVEKTIYFDVVTRKAYTYNGKDLQEFYSPTLAAVATSGSYNDLENKPTIPVVPTNVSSFTNDVGYLTSHQSLANYYTKSEVDALTGVPIVEIQDIGAVSQELAANTFYKFTGALTSLTLALTAGTGLVVYAGKFTSDSSTACTLSLPASVTEAPNNPTIEVGKTYEFNIADNVLLMVEV